MKKFKKPKKLEKLEIQKGLEKLEKLQNFKNKMASFYFPQFEHEIFWQYLSRLNEFRAQCVDYCFEKWEIYQVIFESLNDEYRGLVETVYREGLDCLFTRTPDEVWNFFEKLAWDTYAFEQLETILDTQVMESVIFMLILTLQTTL